MAALVGNKRNLARKFETIWRILIKANMWPITEKEIKTVAHIVAKYLLQVIRMRRCGSLISIHPSAHDNPPFSKYFQPLLNS